MLVPANKSSKNAYFSLPFNLGGGGVEALPAIPQPSTQILHCPQFY
jgi:hypothetical protein